jgi:hypothetical protein
MTSLSKWLERQQIEGFYPVQQDFFYEAKLGESIVYPILTLTVEQWLDLWAETEIERIKHDIMLREWRREIDAKVSTQREP